MLILMPINEYQHNLMALMPLMPNDINGIYVINGINAIILWH